MFSWQFDTCSCFSLGADDAMGMELACAIEAAHACSLVHDDLPAMDNDLMRRGKLTVPTIW